MEEKALAIEQKLVKYESENNVKDEEVKADYNDH